MSTISPFNFNHLQQRLGSALMTPEEEIRVEDIPNIDNGNLPILEVIHFFNIKQYCTEVDSDNY